MKSRQTACVSNKMLVLQLYLQWWIFA